LVKAAQYYQCGPWELLDKPAVWIEIAVISMNAEEHAREMKRERNR
jgi:hypothetical protein